MSQYSEAFSIFHLRIFVKRQIFLPLCSYFYQNIMISAEKTLSLYPVLCNKKVVLAEKKRTNKWLAEQIGVDQATVSKWCTNSAQPNLENLMEIAKCLEVDIQELLRM